MTEYIGQIKLPDSFKLYGLGGRRDLTRTLKNEIKEILLNIDRKVWEMGWSQLLIFFVSSIKTT